jgi:hypothetical protein
MFDDVIQRMEQMFGGLKSALKAQPVEVGDTPPNEVFPIPSKYTYCALSYMRGDPEIEMNVRNRRNPLQSAAYLLKTNDMERVKQWVQAEGFSPSWDNFHLQFGRFSDQEGDYYFFSR